MKMLFSDLDGTLLSKNETKLNNGVIDSLKKLQEAKIDVCIASGRNYVELKNIFNRFNDIYYISDDGALVTLNEKTLFKSAIPLDLISGIDCDFVAHGKYMVYVKSRNEYLKRKICDKYYNLTVYIDSYKEINREIFKITVYGGWMSEKLKMVYTCRDFSEYILPDVSKGCAVEFLLDYLKLNEKECYFFGDNNNDISMFHNKTNSYVMKHATAEVKSKGSFLVENIITTLNDVCRRCDNGNL